MLGKDPDRDREIEYMQNLIQACAESGIPAFKYNLRVLFGVRTGRTPGRGGIDVQHLEVRASQE